MRIGVGGVTGRYSCGGRGLCSASCRRGGMSMPEDGGVGCGSGCDIEPLEAVLTDGACGILNCDEELGIGVAGGAGGAGG